MTMLEPTPIPLHRSCYQGELHLWVGGHRERDDAQWTPGGWGINVLHYNNDGATDPVAAARSGPFELYTKRGEPVLIAAPMAAGEENGLAALAAVILAGAGDLEAEQAKAGNGAAA